MNRNQLLKWAVVLLVITNAVTIGTILYHNYTEKQIAAGISINTGAGINMLNGRFFRQTLGFSEEQLDAFRDLNQVFRPYAMDLTYRVDSIKKEMFSELQNATPDTILLNAMSKQIGELHGQLKYQTYRFYLNLKKICSPSQGVTLGKAFQPLFENENMTAPGQRRFRGRNRD